MREECTRCESRERCFEQCGGQPQYCSEFQDGQSQVITDSLGLDDLARALEEVDQHEAICKECEDKPGCWGANGDDMPDGCTKWSPALAQAFGGKRPSYEEMRQIERECGDKDCAEICGKMGIFYCPLK
jgi:hypothetical protein